MSGVVLLDLHLRASGLELLLDLLGLVLGHVFLDRLVAGLDEFLHVAEGELDRQARLGRELSQPCLEGCLRTRLRGDDLVAQSREKRGPKRKLVKESGSSRDADASTRLGGSRQLRPLDFLPTGDEVRHVLRDEPHMLFRRVRLVAVRHGFEFGQRRRTASGIFMTM